MAAEAEAGGSSLPAEKESKPSRDRDETSSQKKKKRRARLSAASPSIRRRKAPKHRRGQPGDTTPSSSSTASHVDTPKPSTETCSLPAGPANVLDGATCHGIAVCPSRDTPPQDVPTFTPLQVVGTEAAQQPVGAGPVLPWVSPEKCEPSGDAAVADVSPKRDVDAGASTPPSTTSQWSRSTAAASAVSCSEQAPEFDAQVDGESRAGLPETSPAQQLQPVPGVVALAAEDPPLGGVPGHQSNLEEAAGLQVDHDDVGDQTERRDAEQAPKWAAAIAYAGAAEPGARATPSTGTPHLVASPARAALAGIAGTSECCASKLAPHGEPLANKPSSTTELKRRAHFMQYSFAERAASGPSPGPQQLLVIAAAAAAASLLFLVVSALLLVLLRRASSSDDGTDGSDPCGGRPDCRQHRALITSRVNRSIDPCLDFSAHVCSAWSPPGALFREFASTQDDVVLSWARQFPDILEAGARSLPTGYKATALYYKCMENTTHDVAAAATRELHQFMADRGIPWPEEPASPSTAPLGVLFDLAVNWQLPLWFTAHLFPVPGSQSRAIVLTPSGLTLSWAKHHQEILDKGAFVAYYTAFVDALALAEDVVYQDTESIRKVAHVESTILQELASAEKARIPRTASWQFPLREATHHTPSIPSEQWLSEISKNFDVAPAVTGTDLLVAANGVFLKSVDSVFAHYGERELLSHLAWFFVQLLAPVADPRLLVVRYGSEERANAHRPLFCAVHVETVFRVLIISLYAVPRFSASLRNNVDALLRDIRHTAAERLSALPWLDETSKMRGRVKLERMKTILWPATVLLEESGLVRLCRDFAWSNASTFFGAWVKSHRALQQLVRAEKFDIGMPANLALPLLEYDYIRNDVRVSVQSLSRPVYYGHGTIAMFYGGLGFLYAKEVMKALDSEGSRRDYRGVLTDDPWMSSTWRDALMDPEGCLEGASAGGYFPEIPALEISYASLESAFDVSATSMNDRIGERRLFFLTFCYFLCSRSGFEQHPVAGGDCNKAVSNFAPFAETFSCPSGSGMRPKKRCFFFGP
ncbi:endothelin-converting enzyme 1-like isoform X2 [Dermacentor albipictus]|uniref:endothelin-converting enzyme 1-like isoform X2 n=1 Tax=Dermacentor albipictus TaxID=60249 RepID=UPI0038FCB4B4